MTVISFTSFLQMASDTEMHWWHNNTLMFKQKVSPNHNTLVPNTWCPQCMQRTICSLYLVCIKVFLRMAARQHDADSRFAPSQWGTALLCNGVSHWPGANLEWALHVYYNFMLPISQLCNCRSWIFKSNARSTLFRELDEFCKMNSLAFGRFDWILDDLFSS